MRKTRAKNQQGKIIPNGVKPELHEMEIILFYTEMGKDVELIPASHTPGNKRPDFIIDGIEWEAKSPKVSTKKAIERIFFRAAKQSGNIILDLRGLKGREEPAIATLETCFATTRKVHRMHIITKANQLKTYNKS